MHIQQIELHNFKAIEDFKSEFSGGVYLITGENEVGKSTLLGAIATLLTGDRSSNLLTQGKESGYAKMKVGEGDSAYEVELRFSEKNPRGSLTIKTPQGFTSDNKTMLQSLFSYQDFDANEFVSWSNTAEGRRKQVDLVKSLLSIEAQSLINSIDRDLEMIREQRKSINSLISTSEAKLKSVIVSQDDILQYNTAIEIRNLYEKKTTALTTNQRISEVKKRQEARTIELVSLPKKREEELGFIQSEITQLERRIADLIARKQKTEEQFDSQQAKLNHEFTQAKEWLEKNPLLDADEIEEEINNAEFHNGKVSEVTEYLTLKADHNDLVSEKEKYQARISELLSQKSKTIINEKLPIEGLSFDDDGLTLNGVPFAAGEVSTSQEMDVAVKLIIAKNPKVKVFRIAQGESLGSAKLKAIVDFAKENGYQGFIEEVRRGQQDLIIEEYIEA